MVWRVVNKHKCHTTANLLSRPLTTQLIADMAQANELCLMPSSHTRENRIFPHHNISRTHHSRASRIPHTSDNACPSIVPEYFPKILSSWPWGNVHKDEIKRDAHVTCPTREATMTLLDARDHKGWAHPSASACVRRPRVFPCGRAFKEWQTVIMFFWHVQWSHEWTLNFQKSIINKWRVLEKPFSILT